MKKVERLLRKMQSRKLHSRSFQYCLYSNPRWGLFWYCSHFQEKKQEGFENLHLIFKKVTGEQSRQIKNPNSYKTESPLLPQGHHLHGTQKSVKSETRWFHYAGIRARAGWLLGAPANRAEDQALAQEFLTERHQTGSCDWSLCHIAHQIKAMLLAPLLANKA